MEISILEYIVYALMSYSTIIFVIQSAFKKYEDLPNTRVLALIRSSYVIIGIIASGILAQSGINIDLNTVTTNSLIKSINTTQTWSQSVSQTNQVVLQNPVWVMFHWLIMIVLIWYVINQILMLFTKAPKQGVNEEEYQD